MDATNVMDATNFESAVKKFESSVATSDFIGKYLAVKKCEAACAVCPHYNQVWACPPFDYDPILKIGRYPYVTVFATKIPLPYAMRLEDIHDYMEPHKKAIEAELLNRENKTSGFACGLGGGCNLCSPCRRTIGEPCMHPALVRPELEAFGFEIQPIIKDLFNLEFSWGKDGKAPQYLILVTALFHR